MASHTFETCRTIPLALLMSAMGCHLLPTDDSLTS
jgi:hypothetical protein